jgi:hypothetical protein
MAGDTEIFELMKLHLQIQNVIQHLLLYDGKFDPKGYVKWELGVHLEFCKHNLLEEQKNLADAGVLIDYTLALWKRLCRHDKLPKTWNALKIILREYFVPEYYADHLLAKLRSLKQGSNTIET